MPNKVLFTLFLCGSLLSSPAFGQSEKHDGDHDGSDDGPPITLVNHYAGFDDLASPAKNFNPFANTAPAVITRSNKRCMQFGSNTRQSFWAYKEAFKKCIAGPNGISQEIISKTVDTANFSPRERIVRDPNRPPPSFRDDYLSAYLDKKNRPFRGALDLNHNEETLQDIEQQYGVPGHVLMGLRCAETDCGEFFGDRGVIESGLTRAFIGRRENLFLGATIHALQLMETGVLPVDAPSSWAACVGQYQFLPYNYFRAAVDADGGGVDLFNSFDDASYSAANLLVDKGWQADKHIAFTIANSGANSGTDELNWRHAGPWNARPLSEWMEMGIKFDGQIPDHAMDEQVTMRNMAWGGDDDPYWVAFGENGDVIHKWNQSWAYVAMVHLMTQEIQEEAYRLDRLELLEYPAEPADLIEFSQPSPGQMIPQTLGIE